MTIDFAMTELQSEGKVLKIFLLSGLDYSGRHSLLFTHLNFNDFNQAQLIVSTVFIFPMRSQHAFAPRF